jgi:uncharacterized protein YbaR (Trm112 family)
VALLDGRPAPFGIAAQVWDLLACPCPEHAPLVPDEAAQQAVCTSCGRRFPVADGIPVLLLDEAVPGPGMAQA